MNARTMLLALVLLTSSQAWARDEQAGGSESGRRSSPPGAEVGFANLAEGAVVPPTFTAQFFVHGMAIAPAGTDVAYSGHHHLLIDVEALPDPNLPLPANEHHIHYGRGQTMAELTLAEGPHTLQLLFADYLHRPHDPVVMSPRINITVSPDAPPPPLAAAD